MSDSEVEDEGIGVASKTLSARKRRLSSSEDETKNDDLSEDNDDRTPERKLSKSTAKTASRSSDRIKTKKNKSFSMPTRDEIWKDIPSTVVPEKSLDYLKPRKLVNNFTRITHRYNHDPAYTSDEGSSLEDFIEIDEKSESEDSDVGCRAEKKSDRKCHRIKNYRGKCKLKRVINDSSSSSSDMDMPDKNSNTTDVVNVTSTPKSATRREASVEKSWPQNVKKSDISGNKSDESFDAYLRNLEDKNGNDEEDSDNSNIKSCSIRKKRTFVLESEGSDSEGDSKRDNPGLASRAKQQAEQRQKKRENLFKDFKAARARHKPTASTS